MRSETGPQDGELQTRNWGQLFITLVALLVFGAFYLAVHGT